MEDDEIKGEFVPKGSIMFLSVFAAQRSPHYWERPTEFDPDRFLPDRIKDQPKLSYMPFGAGPRMCIGNHFAMMEMQLLLAMMARRFDFTYLDQGEPEYLSLITLKPKDGIRMRLEARC